MGYGTGKLKALMIEKPSLKPGMYCDGGGLWLRVSGPTARSWCFRYMLDGKAREMGLGKQRDLTLAKARELADNARRLKALGKDPLTERETVRSARVADAAKAITFKQCAEAYIEAHRAGWKNEKHAAQWPSTLEQYVYPTMGAVSAQDIDTAMVMKVLEQKSKAFEKDQTLWTARPETASRLRGRIELILDWATAREYRRGDNPARWRGHLQNLLPARSKVARVQHHPALPYAEIGDFVAELKAKDDTAARALEFCILTATRTNETLGATWDEIDIESKVWTIPAERMKAGKEHRVPLAGRALEILGALKRGNTDNFVFRGRSGGQLSNMSMLMLLRRIGRGDLTVHGFRSTFRDWAGETTAHPREVIEHAMAHSLKDKAEAAYQRGDLFEKRRVLMGDWAKTCTTPLARKVAHK